MIFGARAAKCSVMVVAPGLIQAVLRKARASAKKGHRKNQSEQQLFYNPLSSKISHRKAFVHSCPILSSHVHKSRKKEGLKKSDFDVEAGKVSAKFSFCVMLVNRRHVMTLGHFCYDHSRRN